MKIRIETKWTFPFRFCRDIITGKIKLKNIITSFNNGIKLLKENKFIVYLVDRGTIVAKYTKDEEYHTFDAYEIYKLSGDKIDYLESKIFNFEEEITEISEETNELITLT